MSKIIPVTTTITGDEKAWGLYELNFQSPGSKGFHRYQIIQVPRDGVMCEWRKDLGRASKFKGVNQLRIPSFMVHSVDELMAIANASRHRSEIDVKDFLQLENYIPA